MRKEYVVHCGTLPYEVTTPNPRIWRVALCDGRHQIPDAVDGAIYPAEINPLDVEGLQSAAEKWFDDHVRSHWAKHDYANVLEVDSVLHLYVTGLSVALVAVINAATIYGVPLELLHYDKASGTYYSQDVPSTILGNLDPITG